MSKLYPPIIEETLPAFYSENGIVKFTIPFSMNRAVSQSEIGGFELKIRAIQSGNQLYTVETYKPTDYAFEKNNTFVSFYIEDKDNKLKIGQFYKLQLAYIYIDLNTKNYFLQLHSKAHKQVLRRWKEAYSLNLLSYLRLRLSPYTSGAAIKARPQSIWKHMPVPPVDGSAYPRRFSTVSIRK